MSKKRQTILTNYCKKLLNLLLLYVPFRDVFIPWEDWWRDAEVSLAGTAHKYHFCPLLTTMLAKARS